MTHWLSNPRVRLALLFNGLYFLSLYAPADHARWPQRPHAYEHFGADAPRRPPVYVPLPPSTTPTRATSHRDERTGELNVYLQKDLSLTGSRGRRLLLSPTFAVRKGDGSPESVLLRFISFSDAPLLSDGAGFVISADGRQVWPAVDQDGEPLWEGWAEEKVPPSTTPVENGGVVENVGKTIPYEVFAEVIRAKRVVLSLGPHLVELNAEQLEALRDLHRYTTQPPEYAPGR
jgi:hypothetical protein